MNKHLKFNQSILTQEKFLQIASRRLLTDKTIKGMYFPKFLWKYSLPQLFKCFLDYLNYCLDNDTHGRYLRPYMLSQRICISHVLNNVSLESFPRKTTENLKEFIGILETSAEERGMCMWK